MIFTLNNTNQDGYYYSGDTPPWHQTGDVNNVDYVIGMIGLVFPNITIPKNAVITSAYINTLNFGTPGTGTTKILINGFAEDNTATFLSDGSNYPATRPYTLSGVEWDAIFPFSWAWRASPDLSSVIQEIVNRDGWVSGNNMGFVLADNGSAGNNFAISDYSRGSANSAQLVVTYTLAAKTIRIRVALPGYNADTDNNPDHFSVFADNNNILIKEKTRGSASIANGSSTTITHNLGYLPLVFVFAEVSTGVWAALFGDSSDYNAWIEITNTTLIIHNSLGATHNFKYYIFYDNLSNSVAPTITETKPNFKIGKIGKSINSTNPNDFIVHSNLNTFKVILEGNTSFNFTSAGGIQEFTLAHGLAYTPLVYGFAKFKAALTGIEVMSPNQEWVDVTDNSIRFNSIVSDSTNIRFRITNNSFSTGILYVKYYIFEVPL